MTSEGVVLDGRYRLGELLGVGGSGSVFSAWDEATPGRRVAVKLLHPHLCASDAARGAFLREAEHLVALSHPNIIRAHAAGIHDAAGVLTPWLAIDLLRGTTLQAWSAAGAGDASRVVRDVPAILRGMLAGLGAAHGAGIVHGDLSPSNVFLEGADGDVAVAPGMVRLVDFGLARLAGEALAADDVPLAAESSAGRRQVVGNPAFMSPEQVRGEPLTPASDVYQAGAVLYFLLTGRVPYQRAEARLMLRAHLIAPVPVPSALVPAHHRYDGVVTKAMAKEPGRRHADVDEFLAALDIADVDAGAPTPATAVLMAADDRTGVLPARRTTVREPATSGDRPAYLTPQPPVAPVLRRRSGGAGPAVAVLLLVVGVAVALAWLGRDPAEGTVAQRVVATPSAAPRPTTAAPAPASPSALPTVTASASAMASPSPVTVAPATSTAPPSPPPPAVVSVPALYGTVEDADGILSVAGLRVGRVVRTDSAYVADAVLAQSPSPGQLVEAGSSVDLTIASGSNAVPDLVGATMANAMAFLQSAGFIVAVEPEGAAATETVIAVQPEAGTVLRVGTTVTLVTALPGTPEPSPTPSPSVDGSQT